MAAIPRAQSALVDRAGFPTREWYTYFLDLANSQGMTSAQQAQLVALAEAVNELQNETGSFQFIGSGSVRIHGTPAAGTVQITLENDADSPGASWYYGTGPDGDRGWYSLADGFTVTSDLTKVVDGTTGVTTYGLAELADTGEGAALVKITRDSYGRVEGTEAATTDDLPEGENLYYTDARAAAAAAVQEAPEDGNAYARKDGSWAQITANASIQFPFYDAAGAFSPVPLTSNNELPFYLTDGTQANIPMVTS